MVLILGVVCFGFVWIFLSTEGACLDYPLTDNLEV